METAGFTIFLFIFTFSTLVLFRLLLLFVRGNCTDDYEFSNVFYVCFDICRLGFDWYCRML
jgi:hypothetical protein